MNPTPLRIPALVLLGQGHPLVYEYGWDVPGGCVEETRRWFVQPRHIQMECPCEIVDEPEHN
jgi:hypothetical protein